MLRKICEKNNCTFVAIVEQKSIYNRNDENGKEGQLYFPKKLAAVGSRLGLYAPICPLVSVINPKNKEKRHRKCQVIHRKSSVGLYKMG